MQALSFSDLVMRIKMEEITSREQRELKNLLTEGCEIEKDLFVLDRHLGSTSITRQQDVIIGREELFARLNIIAGRIQQILKRGIIFDRREFLPSLKITKLSLRLTKKDIFASNSILLKILEAGLILDENQMLKIVQEGIGERIILIIGGKARNVAIKDKSCKEVLAVGVDGKFTSDIEKEIADRLLGIPTFDRGHNQYNQCCVFLDKLANEFISWVQEEGYTVKKFGAVMRKGQIFISCPDLSPVLKPLQ